MMYKWVDGLPVENATDNNDSARLAGIIKTFKFEGWDKFDISRYYQGGVYVRHPSEQYYINFSRDQYTPLISGLWCEGRTDLVSPHFVTGNDFLSPSVLGHTARCEGKSANCWQDLALEADVEWAIRVKPDAELNQLLCMLMVSGLKEGNWGLMKKLRDNHISWRENLRSYWGGWREVPELAEHMIQYIERI